MIQSYTGQNLNENALVSYIGDLPNQVQIGEYFVPQPYYYPLYEYHYHNWYPTLATVVERSKIEQGFKVVGKMIENKIITKELTVKEFIKLVNDIAEIL